MRMGELNFDPAIFDDPVALKARWEVISVYEIIKDAHSDSIERLHGSLEHCDGELRLAQGIHEHTGLHRFGVYCCMSLIPAGTFPEVLVGSVALVSFVLTFILVATLGEYLAKRIPHLVVHDMISPEVVFISENKAMVRRSEYEREDLVDRVIHAIQIVTYSRAGSAPDFVQVNCVFIDGVREPLRSYTNPFLARKEAAQIADFLGVKVWDASKRR